MEQTLTNEQKQKLIDDIMDSFDFAKVHRVMKFLNWTWAGDLEPPDEFELRRYARKLLKESLDKQVSITTAGFKVTYRGRDDIDHIYLDLTFYVDDWSVCLADLNDDETEITEK